ncbi:MAG: gliding motility protein [Deltaproteobacteria bacterium]|nr:MAG: gliding motility protein [Deltaproteobacteria bacterium]UCF46727.1 MAG: gliding motility protein [Myxococcales bacterium]
MQVDFGAKELTVKLVYYGPALSGKTTNLRAIHWLGTSSACGELMTLETQNDRTLFFDMLPITVSSESSLKVRLKLFTVPGQVMHNATRRLVLQATDGVAFIADSQRSEANANRESFLNLKQNLEENGIDPARIPIIIQFNKRDMDDIRPDEELEAIANQSRETIYKAVATRGYGVMQTLRGLIRETWDKLEEEHQLEKKFGISPARFMNEVELNLKHNPGRQER